MGIDKAIKMLEEIIDEGWLISDLEKCPAIDSCELAINIMRKYQKQERDLDKIRSEIDEIGGEYDPYLGCSKSQIDSLPSVEAIPKAEYEARLKADMVAMLTEIQLEIEEHEESIIGHYGKETKESDFPSHKIERNNGRKECVNLIQQKIAKLKG